MQFADIFTFLKWHKNCRYPLLSHYYHFKKLSVDASKEFLHFCCNPSNINKYFFFIFYLQWHRKCLESMSTTKFYTRAVVPSVISNSNPKVLDEKSFTLFVFCSIYFPSYPSISWWLPSLSLTL